MQGELKITVKPKNGDIDMELEVQCRLIDVSSYDKIALFMNLARELNFSEIEWRAMYAMRCEHCELGGMDAARSIWEPLAKRGGEQV